MATHKWVKQLTRENSLLDRSLRSLAYAKSIPEVGQARMTMCPVVGRGRITSWYYDVDEYQRQQQIILNEFSGKNIEIMGNKILELLEVGYMWAEEATTPTNSSKFIEHLDNFNSHHAHSRGAVCYGYWGEPAVTDKLKKLLVQKVLESELDATISLLSTPHKPSGRLLELFHQNSAEEEKRRVLIENLKLTNEEKELAEILSWFTLFYEIGERVSSYLYDKLIAALKSITSTDEFKELEWYDSAALIGYFRGKKLSDGEIAKRKEFYILLCAGDACHFDSVSVVERAEKSQHDSIKISPTSPQRARGRDDKDDIDIVVLSGKEARDYYAKEFASSDVVIQGDITEVKGTVASKGKATGTVRIVITEEEQSKIKVGEILVSTMTTPRLMTACKKAAAIVTDEGGMTAHAAIVSRELGIPCIVGTKIATTVFKDGDRVEVDADKGTVKKI